MSIKIKVPTVVEKELTTIHIAVPVRYDEEDIPNDFPFRRGDVWDISYTPEGQIIGWGNIHRAWFAANTEHENMQDDGTYRVHMKVCDSGSYWLVGIDGEEIAALTEEYVPHGVVPGEYGDYVIMNITGDGKIMNMPKRLTFKAFFEDRN